MNAIGYVRISVRDQSRYSLDYQQSAIRDYCEKNRVDLLELFKDDGESSYTFDRPDWLALENFIKQHKGHVQYLIVMDHDRFSRNLPEALTKISQLEKRFGIKVIATNEPLDIDTSDPSVFMQRAFTYLIANKELLGIRKRTTNGLRQAWESGRFVNKAPYGYINTKDERGKGLIRVDENKSFIVKKIFTDFLLGKQLKLIHREAIEFGLLNKGNSTIPRILSNCVYAGLIKLPASKKGPERFIKGIHEPIICETDFWRAQNLLNGKKRPSTVPDNTVPLRGFVHCHCGKKFTAGFSKGKNKYYLYYRCPAHNETNIPGGYMHETFDKVLDLLSWSTEQVTYLKNTVTDKFNDIMMSRKKQLTQKNTEINKITKRLEQLEDHLMDEVIDAQTYKKHHRKMMGEKALLSAQAIELKDDVESKWRTVEAVLPCLTKLKDIYHLATVEQKHALLGQVFKQGLSFVNGSFRTPSLHPALIHNELILNGKRLLLTKQPLTSAGLSPIRSENGS